MSEEEAPPKRGRGRPKGSKSHGGNPWVIPTAASKERGERLAKKARESLDMGVAARVMSVRGSLTEQQRAFCLHVTNGLTHRQALLLALGEEAKGFSTQRLISMGHRWIKEPLIVAYMDELAASPAVSARLMRSTTVKTGEGIDAQRAGNAILEEEAASGHREAAEQWAEHLCAIGARVVVPFPTKTRGMTTCPCGCDHLFEVELPVKAEIPFASLFPHIADRVDPEPEAA